LHGLLPCPEGCGLQLFVYRTLPKICAHRLLLELLSFEKASEVLDDLIRHLFLNVVTALYGLVRDDV
jgi:hypothetical protein